MISLIIPPGDRETIFSLLFSFPPPGKGEVWGES